MTTPGLRIPGAPPASILVVCTGNICRSPFAERALAGRLQRTWPGQFEVRSAGTQARGGDEMEPETAALLAEIGYDTRGFVSQHIAAAHVARYDLILTMTRAHRTRVLTDNPGMLHRIFTLREFARILRMVEPPAVPDGWESIVRLASAERSKSRPHTAIDDDTADPYRLGMAAFRGMGLMVTAAVEEIAAALTRFGYR